MKSKLPEKYIKLLHIMGTAKASQSHLAGEMLAQAFTLPLREAVFAGDIVSDIFQTQSFEPGQSIEYPMDLIAPGSEDQFVAFAIPNTGRIPNRYVEGDYVMVPTFRIAGDMTWALKYARDARWDVMTRAMRVLRDQFVAKTNDDGWQTIITAAFDRNIRVNDPNATAGQFTKRLLSLMQSVMRRNGGGNSSSVNRTKMTDLYISVEANETISNWNVDQVDEVTRREILVREGEDTLSRLFGVNLHTLDELGVDQKYQLFYTNTLSGTLATGDQEICVGVSKTRQTFMRPIREELSLHNDPAAHREQMASFYGWMEHGFASLDNRDVIIGSL